MKFKTIEVKDTVTRQKTMEISSEKELVLFAESFTSEDNTNNEFVIGLPLAVREYNQGQIEGLATELRTKFETVADGRQYAIAIHNKKLEDEVHFHISYCGDAIDADSVYNLYLY